MVGYFLDGDGKIEIAVGFSDRLVRTYRWYPFSDSKSGEIVFLNKWSLDAQVCYCVLSGEIRLLVNSVLWCHSLIA